MDNSPKNQLWQHVRPAAEVDITLGVMNSSKRITITTILAAGATFASITYHYLSSPNALVLSKDGEIAGIANVVRAQLQGNAFWKNQLFEAKIGRASCRERVCYPV